LRNARIEEGVNKMKFDNRLVTGIFIGMLLGLHYHVSLIAYLPVLVLLTVIFTFKMIRH